MISKSFVDTVKMAWTTSHLHHKHTSSATLLVILTLKKCGNVFILLVIFTLKKCGNVFILLVIFTLKKCGNVFILLVIFTLKKCGNVFMSVSQRLSIRGACWIVSFTCLEKTCPRHSLTGDQNPQPQQCLSKQVSQTVSDEKRKGRYTVQKDMLAMLFGTKSVLFEEMCLKCSL